MSVTCDWNSKQLFIVILSNRVVNMSPQQKYLIIVVSIYNTHSQL